MSDKLLDHTGKSHRLLLVLKIARWANPCLSVLLLMLDLIDQRPASLLLMCFQTIAIAILVSVCGYYFKKNLTKYLGGGFIGRVGSRLTCQVQLNVLVICICYISRFVYDLLLLYFNDQFTDMRKNEAKTENSDRWYYSILFFTIMFVSEYCPIAMFTLNLRFVFNHQAELSPKQTPRDVSQPKEMQDILNKNTTRRS